MFFDDSPPAPMDDNDFCMSEECDSPAAVHPRSSRLSSPPPFFSGLPSSPIDEEQTCYVIIEDQRHHIHSLSSTSASFSSSSTSTVVRGFPAPPRRVSWREHMRDVQRATMAESAHRLSTLRGGIEKRRRGKGGHVMVAGRREHRPGCALHVWSLVQHHMRQQQQNELQHSDHPAGCSCISSERKSGVSDDLIDRLRRLTRFDHRLVEMSRPHRFTYSYKLDYSLDSIPEDVEECDSGCGSSSSSDLQQQPQQLQQTPPTLGRISGSSSPEPQPSRPHCSSPAAAAAGDPETAAALQQLQLQPPVLSEEEMCQRLSALPIGYHSTATVAALETALHSSLSLMDSTN